MLSEKDQQPTVGHGCASLLPNGRIDPSDIKFLKLHTKLSDYQLPNMWSYLKGLYFNYTVLTEMDQLLHLLS